MDGARDAVEKFACWVKYDFRLGILTTSDSAAFCLTCALSDPKNPCFAATLPDDHQHVAEMPSALLKCLAELASIKQALSAMNLQQV